MFRYIIMTCGYAESQQTSILVYSCEYMGHPGFQTRAEAITELALDLHAKLYDGRLGKKLAACCTKTNSVVADAKFCSSCGKRIENEGFDADEFAQFVTELHVTTCDSYGEADATPDRDFVWSPWSSFDLFDAPRDEMILIAESAERVLLSALYDAKSDLRAQVSEVLGEDVQMHDDWKAFKRGEQPKYRV